MGNPANRDPRTRQTFFSTMRPEAYEEITCAEAECEMYAEGWVTKVPAVGPQALYIRTQSGREFREELRGEQAWFYFAPGQRCFQQHRLGVAPPKLLHFNQGGSRPVRAGDIQRAIRNRETWRAPDWLEKFQEETDKAATLRQKG